MSSKFLRVHDVCALIGLGRTTIYALEKKGDFPRRIALVGKAVAWQESEVKEWMEARLAARKGGRPLPEGEPQTIASEAPWNWVTK